MNRCAAGPCNCDRPDCYQRHVETPGAWEATYAIVEATCPDVEAAFAALTAGILHLIPEQRHAAAEFLIHNCQGFVKRYGTEKLRRALVHLLIELQTREATPP